MRRREREPDPQAIDVPADLADAFVEDWEQPGELTNADGLPAWSRWRRARAEFGREHDLEPGELAALVPDRGPRWRGDR